MRHRSHSRRSKLSPGLRLIGLTLLALLVVLLPFVLWGERLEERATSWLRESDRAWWTALLGVALLVADVLLPVPSSVVSVALCWALGPFWGAISIAIGNTLGFGTGYGIGRLAPERRLRGWVGEDLWDRARALARTEALWWIAMSRPLPVLAEIAALLAGVARVPWHAALGHAMASSCLVGAVYGASAWLGQQEPSLGGTLLVLLAWPSFTWALHRVCVHRVLKQASSTALAVHQEH